MDDAFGWAIANRAQEIMFPVHSTRVAAIAEFVSSMDCTVPGPKPENISALGEIQWNAWRRDKHNFGVRCVRVRVRALQEKK